MGKSNPHRKQTSMWQALLIQRTAGFIIGYKNNEHFQTSEFWNVDIFVSANLSAFYHSRVHSDFLKEQLPGYVFQLIANTDHDASWSLSTIHGCSLSQKLSNLTSCCPWSQFSLTDAVTSTATIPWLWSFHCSPPSTPYFHWHYFIHHPFHLYSLELVWCLLTRATWW